MAAITCVRPTIAAAVGALELCGSHQARKAQDRCHRVLSARADAASRAARPPSSGVLSGHDIAVPRASVLESPQGAVAARG